MGADFDDFFKSEYPGVYRAAFASCWDEQVALDATQEAFSRAFARWGRLSKEAWPGGWVMTTALNVCKRSPSRPLPAETLNGADEPTVDSDLHVDLQAALRRLPLRQRQVLFLHYIAELPLAAVASLMGCSEGTIKTHLSRGRQSLARELAPSEGERRL